MIATMEYEHVLVDRDGAVAVVTFNRPRVLNALSPALIAELSDALGRFDADPEVRAVVLTGGPRVVEQLQRDQTGSWARLAGFAKPLVAAVNGYALGGGCELALMCDLIVAGDNARFGQPEINLGVIPGAGGTQRWPRTVGKYVAMEVNLEGTPITAQRAYQLGLVNKVVPAEVTIQVAREIAARLAEKPPVAVRLAKESVNRALEVPLSEGLAAERRSFYFLFATEDQKEGMRAFLEKRRAQFKGR